MKGYMKLHQIQNGRRFQNGHRLQNGRQMAEQIYTLKTAISSTYHKKGSQLTYLAL